MSNKKVGYSFWGFLGDVKMNENKELISTPDGNAFYSWSIIEELQKRGYEVLSIMPDRDKPAINVKGDLLFSSWCKDRRANAYNKMNKLEYKEINEKSLKNTWDRELINVDFILLEWRFEIKGRNDNMSIGNDNWQPDWYIQNELLKYCKEKGIKVIVFDLDYKLTEKDIKKYGIKYIIELGDKWSKCWIDVKAKKTEIPFNFSCIDYFEIEKEPTKNLLYVGNRYERDWCIDKYIPEDLDNVCVYGNWKESGRDSEERWPLIKFCDRLQTKEMRDVYKDYIATILLAKDEYCEYNFVTARILEAIFYGVVPFFIEEFDRFTIEKYAGKNYTDFLTVSSKEDLKNKIVELKENKQVRIDIIESLRKNLEFMDVKYFVDDLLYIVR